MNNEIHENGGFFPLKVEMSTSDFRDRVSMLSEGILKCLDTTPSPDQHHHQIYLLLPLMDLTNWEHTKNHKTSAQRERVILERVVGALVHQNSRLEVCSEEDLPWIWPRLVEKSRKTALGSGSGKLNLFPLFYKIPPAEITFTLLNNLLARMLPWENEEGRFSAVKGVLSVWEPSFKIRESLQIKGIPCPSSSGHCVGPMELRRQVDCLRINEPPGGTSQGLEIKDSNVQEASPKWYKFPIPEFPFARFTALQAVANSECEDGFLVSVCDELNAGLVSVMDGHGGPLVMDMVRDRLDKYIFNSLASVLATAANVQSSGGGGGGEQDVKSVDKRETEEDALLDEKIHEALTRAILELDKDIIELVKAKTLQVVRTKTDGKAILETETSLLESIVSKRKDVIRGIWNSGCCAVFCLIWQGKVFCGNLGDCRCLFYSEKNSSGNEISSSSPAAPEKFKVLGEVESQPNFVEDIFHLVPEGGFVPSGASAAASAASANASAGAVAAMNGTVNHHQSPKRQKLDAPAGVPTSEILPLTRDHNCEDYWEVQRILKLSKSANSVRAPGSCLGPLKVDGVLTPTRAFGDVFLKGYDRIYLGSGGNEGVRGEGGNNNNISPLNVTSSSAPTNVEDHHFGRREVFITAEPEFLKESPIVLNKYKNPVLVLATDGLFQFFSNEDVMRVMSLGEDAGSSHLLETWLQKAGESIGQNQAQMRLACPGPERRRLYDDVTAIVLRFSNDSTTSLPS